MPRRWVSYPGTRPGPCQGVCWVQRSVWAVYGHCLPLGSISTKQQVFKTLVRDTDNYNRIQSGKFLFLVESGKKKKRKRQMLHMYRMNHRTAGKILKDKEHITHLGAGAGPL